MQPLLLIAVLFKYIDSRVHTACPELLTDEPRRLRGVFLEMVEPPRLGRPRSRFSSGLGEPQQRESQLGQFPDHSIATFRCAIHNVLNM